MSKSVQLLMFKDESLGQRPDSDSPRSFRVNMRMNPGAYFPGAVDILNSSSPDTLAKIPHTSSSLSGTPEISRYLRGGRDLSIKATREFHPSVTLEQVKLILERFGKETRLNIDFATGSSQTSSRQLIFSYETGSGLGPA